MCGVRVAFGQAQKRPVRRRRLQRESVQDRPANPAGRQRVMQRVVIHQRAARRVHQQRARLHQADAGAVHQAGRLRRHPARSAPRCRIRAAGRPAKHSRPRPPPLLRKGPKPAAGSRTAPAVSAKCFPTCPQPTTPTVRSASSSPVRSERYRSPRHSPRRSDSCPARIRRVSAKIAPTVNSATADALRPAPAQSESPAGPPRPRQCSPVRRAHRDEFQRRQFFQHPGGHRAR